MKAFQCQSDKVNVIHSSAECQQGKKENFQRRKKTKEKLPPKPKVLSKKEQEAQNYRRIKEAEWLRKVIMQHQHQQQEKEERRLQKEAESRQELEEAKLNNLQDQAALLITSSKTRNTGDGSWNRKKNPSKSVKRKGCNLMDRTEKHVTEADKNIKIEFVPLRREKKEKHYSIPNTSSILCQAAEHHMVEDYTDNRAATKRHLENVLSKIREARNSSEIVNEELENWNNDDSVCPISVSPSCMDQMGCFLELINHPSEKIFRLNPSQKELERENAIKKQQERERKMNMNDHMEIQALEAYNRRTNLMNQRLEEQNKQNYRGKNLLGHQSQNIKGQQNKFLTRKQNEQTKAGRTKSLKEDEKGQFRLDSGLDALEEIDVEDCHFKEEEKGTIGRNETTQHFQRTDTPVPCINIWEKRKEKQNALQNIIQFRADDRNVMLQKATELSKVQAMEDECHRFERLKLESKEEFNDRVQNSDAEDQYEVSFCENRQSSADLGSNKTNSSIVTYNKTTYSDGTNISRIEKQRITKGVELEQQFFVPSDEFMNRQNAKLDKWKNNTVSHLSCVLNEEENQLHPSSYEISEADDTQNTLKKFDVCSVSKNPKNRYSTQLDLKEQSSRNSMVEAKMISGNGFLQKEHIACASVEDKISSDLMDAQRNSFLLDTSLEQAASLGIVQKEAVHPYRKLLSSDTCSIHDAKKVEKFHQNMQFPVGVNIVQGEEKFKEMGSFKTNISDIGLDVPVTNPYFESGSCIPFSSQSGWENFSMMGQQYLQNQLFLEIAMRCFLLNQIPYVQAHQAMPPNIVSLHNLFPQVLNNQEVGNQWVKGNSHTSLLSPYQSNDIPPTDTSVVKPKVQPVVEHLHQIPDDDKMFNASSSPPGFGKNMGVLVNKIHFSRGTVESEMQNKTSEAILSEQRRKSNFNLEQINSQTQEEIMKEDIFHNSKNSNFPSQPAFANALGQFKGRGRARLSKNVEIKQKLRNPGSDSFNLSSHAFSSCNRLITEENISAFNLEKQDRSLIDRKANCPLPQGNVSKKETRAARVPEIQQQLVEAVPAPPRNPRLLVRWQKELQLNARALASQKYRCYQENIQNF
ncbi:trichohyalin-like isoform X2 [Limulus polyphemus]|nr:trichohyalin-like isoform X2 [Limulus polyphemus]